MGVELKARNLAQVSMNLTDFETTSMATVFEAVALEAAALGVQVVGSEIVGLVPRQALEDAAVHFLRVENFRPELIVENRLEQVLAERMRENRSSGLHRTRDRMGHRQSASGNRFRKLRCGRWWRSM